ncbi:hypothetical protein COP2_037410 [Malus domestica]
MGNYSEAHIRQCLTLLYLLSGAIPRSRSPATGKRPARNSWLVSYIWPKACSNSPYVPATSFPLLPSTGAASLVQCFSKTINQGLVEDFFQMNSFCP